MQLNTQTVSQQSIRDGRQFLRRGSYIYLLINDNREIEFK